MKTDLIVDIPALAAALKAEACERMVSVRQVEAATGVSKSTMVRITLHHKTPCLIDYVKLCGWLGVKLERFIKDGL